MGRVGEEAHPLQAHDLHEEHEAVVHVEHLLGQLVLALLRRLQHRAEPVAAREQLLGRRRRALHAELLAQLPPLDAQERLVEPVVGEEHHAGEHLAGGETLVGARPGELAGELLGEGGQGAHAPVVGDEGAPCLLGHVAGERPLRPGSGGDGAEQQRGGGGAPSAHCAHFAEQLAETAAAVGQHAEHRRHEQRVAGVADARPPVVLAHAERRPLPVVVIARLVEARAVGVVDVVHRHGGALGAPVAAYDDVRAVVGGGCAVGAVGHAEPLQSQREGQRVARSVVEGVLAGGLSRPQVHAAVPSGESGGERSDEDDGQGDVEERRGGPADAAADKVDGARRGRGSPEQGKPGRVVDQAGGLLLSASRADEGGRGHGCGEQRQREECGGTP